MSVDTISEQLRAELQRLDGLRQTLKTQAKENADEIKRIETALAALGDKKQPRKQAATKSDVISAMESALQEQPALAADDLKAVVKTSIAESGRSLQGFALRFREALQERPNEQHTPETA